MPRHWCHVPNPAGNSNVNSPRSALARSPAVRRPRSVCNSTSEIVPFKPSNRCPLIVQLDKERVDRLVEGGEREEAAVAQTRQNPAPDDLDPDFDLGFGV